jgi:hypothetical protein
MGHGCMVRKIVLPIFTTIFSLLIFSFLIKLLCSHLRHCGYFDSPQAHCEKYFLPII